MKKTKTTITETHLYRQGDVLVERIGDALPKNTKAVKTGERIILARGEATGHHHSLAKNKSTALYAGPNSEMYLLVSEGEALLEHQEHATIALPPGTYRVRRQREYSPEAIRNVAD